MGWAMLDLCRFAQLSLQDRDDVADFNRLVVSDVDHLANNVAAPRGHECINHIAHVGEVSPRRTVT
jgi:hypothetical protein